MFTTEERQALRNYVMENIKVSEGVLKLLKAKGLYKGAAKMAKSAKSSIVKTKDLPGAKEMARKHAFRKAILRKAA